MCKSFSQLQHLPCGPRRQLGGFQEQGTALLQEADLNLGLDGSGAGAGGRDLDRDVTGAPARGDLHLHTGKTYGKVKVCVLFWIHL